MPRALAVEDWFLGSERDAQPCSDQVPFFWEVKLTSITKSWKAPFSARSRFAGSSDLSTLDGGAVWGYPEVPQVKCAIALVPASLPHRLHRGLN